VNKIKVVLALLSSSLSVHGGHSIRWRKIFRSRFSVGQEAYLSICFWESFASVFLAGIYRKKT